MTDALESAALRMPLNDPVDVEPPREGDPGGPPCSYCKLPDADCVWVDDHWRVTSRNWSPLLGSVLLLSRAHVDTLSEMAPERQREFGPLAAAIERGIMRLGGVARVHVYRWGDGRAHFHAHFMPRPYGRPQFGTRNLPFLEERLPHPGGDRLAAAAAEVGLALRQAG
jgi:diadenosine tetraphosphate (Ap4A) HIT family hydrolase